MFARLVVFLGTLLMGVNLWAAEPGNAAVLTRLNELLPQHTPDSVLRSPVAGLFEVLYGTELLYISSDGRYLIRGDVIDLQNQSNLSEETRAGVRHARLGDYGTAKTITFAAPKPRHAVTVFTDIDCTYCRKLHREIGAINELGISVHYLLYPRAGIPSPSYDKAVSVWCADDRQRALTVAKASGEIEARKCDNPVLDHMKLGRTVGVTGTPTIILEDGAKIPGYAPAAKLLEFIEQRKQAQASQGG